LTELLLVSFSPACFEEALPGLSEAVSERNGIPWNPANAGRLDAGGVMDG